MIYRLLMPPYGEEQRKRGLPDAEFQAKFINGRRKSVGNQRLCFAHSFFPGATMQPSPFDGQKTCEYRRGNANDRSGNLSRQGNEKNAKRAENPRA